MLLMKESNNIHGSTSKVFDFHSFLHLWWVQHALIQNLLWVMNLKSSTRFIFCDLFFRVFLFSFVRVATFGIEFALEDAIMCQDGLNHPFPCQNYLESLCSIHDSM